MNSPIIKIRWEFMSYPASGDATSTAKPLLGNRLFLPKRVKRIEGTGVRHPLQALLEIIG